MARNNKTSIWKNRRLLAVIALVSLLGFALVAEAASKHIAYGWERTWLIWFYGWSDTLRLLFLSMTQLGTVWMVLVLPITAWASRQRGLAIRLFINGAVALAAAEITKILIDRARPVFLIPGIIPRETLASGNGFPSGHTTVATVMALTLLPYLRPKHRWVVGIWILFVAVSRLYLGVHLPLDVIGGFLLGTSVACVSYLFWGLPQKQNKTS